MSRFIPRPHQLWLVVTLLTPTAIGCGGDEASNQSDDAPLEDVGVADTSQAPDLGAMSDTGTPDTASEPDIADPLPTRTTATLSDTVTYAATSPERFHQSEVLRLTPQALEAGDQLLIDAYATITGPATRNLPILAALRITCGEGGASTGGAWTYANWEGAPRHPDGVQVRVRDLFTAPERGEYGCTLLVLSGAGTLSGEEEVPMQILPGEGVTWIEATHLPTPQLAERWGELRSDGPEIGPGANDRVLRTTFTAPEGVEELTVMADLQLSTCVPSSVSRGWCDEEGDADDALIMTRLFAGQLAEDGESICALSASPPVSGDPRVTTVTNFAHHAKLFHDLTVVLDPACSRDLGVWVETFVASGNPAKVDVATASGLLSVAAVVAE